MTERSRVWLDTETTGLHPDRRAWEIGAILRRTGLPDEELAWFVDIEDLDMCNADPIALEVGGFWQRHPQAHLVPLAGTLANVKPDLPPVPPTARVYREVGLLHEVAHITAGRAYVMGSNPAFDTHTLGVRMAVYGITPGWHYHPIDVPDRAAGWLAGQGREVPVNEKGDEKSDLIAKACGVDPANYERHSALGDCRLFRDLWDAVQPVATVNATGSAAAAAHRFAGELWRLASGLADLGIPLDETVGIDEAAVTTALATLAPVQQGVSTAGHAREAFKLAERMAPRPDAREAPASDWARHYAALALAAHSVARDAVAGLPPNPGKGSRPDIGYLTAIAVSSTAAAAALLGDPAEIAKLLWELTPEAGNLNGEDVDWLADTLDRLGVNPADLYRWFDGADFASPRAEVTA